MYGVWDIRGMFIPRYLGHAVSIYELRLEVGFGMVLWGRIVGHDSGTMLNAYINFSRYGEQGKGLTRGGGGDLIFPPSLKDTQSTYKIV